VRLDAGRQRLQLAVQPRLGLRQPCARHRVDKQQVPIRRFLRWRIERVHGFADD
jgi:hypothetical protein